MELQWIDDLSGEKREEKRVGGKARRSHREQQNNGLGLTLAQHRMSGAVSAGRAFAGTVNRHLKFYSSTVPAYHHQPPPTTPTSSYAMVLVRNSREAHDLAFAN